LPVGIKDPDATPWDREGRRRERREKERGEEEKRRRERRIEMGP